mgnify:FL=1
MRIAVVGAGRIGSAVIKSLLKCGFSNIIATGRRDETLRNASSIGAAATRDNQLAVKSSEVVFLTVKPHHLPEVVKSVPAELWAGRVVVSFIAGVKLATLEKVLRGAEVYRAMPNLNAEVCLSSTAVAHGSSTTHISEVDKLLKCLGRVYWVPEEFLDAWTALAGSGPAFVAEIIDALVLAGVLVGLPRDLAYNAVLDVLEGTSALLRTAGYYPLKLRDDVTTPAGTTIRGLIALESEGVKAALMKAVEAAYKRSVEIGVEINERIKKELGLSD